jgi:hypothetical protein
MRTPPALAALAALALCTVAGAQQAPAPAETFTPHVGPEYTPGFDMMSPQERDDYRDRILAAPTRDECRRMRDEQIRVAAQRASVRGMKYVPDPRYDACEDTPRNKR